MAGRSVERGSSTDGTFGHKVGRIPRVHADFLFMGIASSEDNTPILVVKDDVQEAIFANVVPTKGVNDFAIGCILDDIDTMGHTEIIFKTDNAPSIVAVQEEVKGKRSHKTVLENSVRYHSRSNGLIENANGFIAGVIRTLRSFVRTMLEKELDCNHDVVAWLVKYASTLVDMFHVGRDGHTAYFRRKGKDTHPVIVQFGEKVIYKPLGKNKHNKFDERFCDGVFSGIHRRSGEYYIGTPEGIMGSRTIKSIPEDNDGIMIMFVGLKGRPGLLSQAKIMWAVSAWTLSLSETYPVGYLAVMIMWCQIFGGLVSFLMISRHMVLLPDVLGAPPSRTGVYLRTIMKPAGVVWRTA